MEHALQELEALLLLLLRLLLLLVVAEHELFDDVDVTVIRRVALGRQLGPDLEPAAGAWA